MTTSAPFTTANVEAMVAAFYDQDGTTSGAAADRRHAHEWLTEAQLAPEAWHFAFDLLAVQRSQNTQFFGANTLVIKLSQHFHEIPDGQFDAFLLQLLDVLSTHYAGPRIVVTRLCVAVANTVLGALRRKLWPRPIEDLLKRFQADAERAGGVLQAAGQAVCSVMLKVMKVVPEEFGKWRSKASKDDLGAVSRALKEENMSPVLGLCKDILDPKSSDKFAELLPATIECLQAWVDFGVPVEELDGLYVLLLQALQRPGGESDLYEASLGTMMAIINAPSLDRSDSTLKGLLIKTLPLKDELKRLIDQSQVEEAMAISNIFLSFENRSEQLIKWAQAKEDDEGRKAVDELLNVVLQLSACPGQFLQDEIFSRNTFSFWSALHADMLEIDEPEQLCNYVKCVRPFYSTLVDELLRKAAYPADIDDWSKSDQEQLQSYRDKVSDVLMHSFNILEDKMLGQLLKHLKLGMDEIKADPRKWHYLEVTLLAWSSIGMSVSEEDKPCPLLGQFLKMLSEIEYGQNTRVISAALTCIDYFSEFLPQMPQLFPYALYVVLAALQMKQLGMKSATTLRFLSMHCSAQLRDHCPAVLKACQSALSQGLGPKECVFLMHPIGKMLSAVPSTDVLQHLEVLLLPFMTDLRQLVGLQQAQLTQPSKKKLVTVYKVLGSLFRALELDDEESESESQVLFHQRAASFLALFGQILPLCLESLGKWGQDEQVLEVTFGFLEACTRSLQAEYKPHAPQVIELVNASLRHRPHHSAIALASELLNPMAKDPDLRPMLEQLLANVCAETLKYLGLDKANLSEHSELILEFFQLMTDLIVHHPQYLPSVDLDSTLHCAVVCLGLPEVMIVRNASHLLGVVVMRSPESPGVLEPLVDKWGAGMFRTLIECVAEESNEHKIDLHSDVLFALNKTRLQGMCAWFNDFVEADNYPVACVSKEQKRHFASLVLRERVSKTRVKGLVREFALACYNRSAGKTASLLGMAAPLPHA